MVDKDLEMLVSEYARGGKTMTVEKMLRYCPYCENDFINKDAGKGSCNDFVHKDKNLDFCLGCSRCYKSRCNGIEDFDF